MGMWPQQEVGYTFRLTVDPFVLVDKEPAWIRHNSYGNLTIVKSMFVLEYRSCTT